ncbi:MAG: response regulator [Bacteroidetes bacterium]|nr:response regulator [Bacteroidota bacterium]
MEQEILLISPDAGDKALLEPLLPDGFKLRHVDAVEGMPGEVAVVLIRPDYLHADDIALLEGIAAEYPGLPLILLCTDDTEQLALLRLDQPAWDYFNTSHADAYWLTKTLRSSIRRKGLQEENQRRHREANEAREYSNRLLSRMSHEIRTPLNAVIGMAEMLMDTNLNSKQLYYVQTIYESGSMLVALFNDILDYSKIEAGTIRIHDKPFNLFDSMRESLHNVVGQALEKRLEIISHIDPRLPQVFMGDDLRVRQVVMNLLDNAVKFTSTGSVKLRVYREQNEHGKHLVFEVSDTGPGIRKEVLPLLFKPYVQSETGRQVQKKGVGLGLAIVDHLVKRMHGSIWVESEPGLGTTFKVSLPYRPVDEQNVMQPPAILKGKQVCLVTQNNNLDALVADYMDFCGAHLQIEYTTAEYPKLDHVLSNCDLLITHLRTGNKLDLKLVDMVREKAAIPHILFKDSEKANEKLIVIRKDTVIMMKPADMHEFLEVAEAVLLQKADTLNTIDRHITLDERLGTYHPLDILVAEDNAINQRIILTVLNRYGYQAKMVENGQEVLESLGRRIYDVVLMDIQMPVMDGIEATRRIRQNLPAHRQPAIIALTADVLKQGKEEYLASGFDDVLYKPVQTKALLQLLASCRRIDRNSNF